ncbi:MAG: hypothetical protein ABSH19_07130 [Opitutales bacterium]
MAIIALMVVGHIYADFGAWLFYRRAVQEAAQMAAQDGGFSVVGPLSVRIYGLPGLDIPLWVYGAMQVLLVLFLAFLIYWHNKLTRRIKNKASAIEGLSL